VERTDKLYIVSPDPTPDLGGDTPLHTLPILCSVHPILFDLETALVDGFAVGQGWEDL